MPEERLQKILARAGIASRREAEEMIRLHRVTVNGDVAELGAKADPARDLIRVDGQIVSFKAAAPIYIALYKPTGVISAARAQRQEKRPTVLDLVHVAGRVYPVGRLDADSEGLILLTNDGSLTQRITHPRYGHRKTYHVLVNGHVDDAALDRWRYGGVDLDDGPTGPADVRILRQEGGSTWLEIVMGEGRKRQIRRTAAALHLHVVRLIRTRIGALDLGDMKPGEWRYLSEDEVAQLKRNPAVVKGSFARRSRRTAGEKPGAKAEDRPARPSGPKPRRKDESDTEHAPRKPPAARPPRPSRRRDEEHDAHRPPRRPVDRRPGGGGRRSDKKPGRR